MKFIVYTKPNCHSCEEMKQALANNNHTYESVDMTLLPKEEAASLRSWAKENGQRSMPIVRDLTSMRLITNDKMYEMLGE